MTHHQSALSTLISELLEDPDLAHEGVFRKLLQAGLQDLIDATLGDAPFPQSCSVKVPGSRG